MNPIENSVFSHQKLKLHKNWFIDYPRMGQDIKI